MSKKITSYFGLGNQPLFFRLLISYVLIIALLVSFILFSLVHFRGNVKDEIIKYNTLNLRTTTDSYEQQFEFIQNSMLTFSVSDKIKHIQSLPLDYYAASTLIDDIQKFLSTPFLYLDDLVVLYKNHSFALEKNRGADIDTMFSRFHYTELYGPDYWNKHFNLSESTRILPLTVFSESSWDGRGRLTNASSRIPIIVKNSMNPDLYMIGLADARRMYSAFYRSVDGQFTIMGDDGNIYYTSKPSGLSTFPKFSDEQGFVKEDNYYYFYRKGKQTGLTYVSVIPDEYIYTQMKWNFTLVMLLVLSVVFSIAAALLFSMVLNRPVKRIVESIQKLNLQMPSHSGIREFNFIHERMNQILSTNQDIHQDLIAKKSLLKYYAYMNQLKNIRNNERGLNELVVSDRPFVIVLFQLTFKQAAFDELKVAENRATSFFTEYISHAATAVSEDSLTFQVENDQILSILFTSEDGAELHEFINNINTMLELDKQYLFSTIAVSSRTSDLNAAYNEVLEKMEWRQFDDETQVIDGKINPNPIRPLLSLAQDEEFALQLKSGNDNLLMQIVRRQLHQMKKKEANATHVVEFAKEVIHKVHKELMLRNIDVEFVHTIEEKLYHSNDYEQLEQLFADLFSLTAERINETKGKKDPIVHFVYEYIESHYEQDITLDTLADKLNITRSYLSTYFKEKTGVYFVDYVNSVRINKAKALLMDSDMRIHEAAMGVGYQNINSFNRMFKKFTGVTPSEFRKAETLKEAK